MNKLSLISLLLLIIMSLSAYDASHNSDSPATKITAVYKQRLKATYQAFSTLATLVGEGASEEKMRELYNNSRKAYKRAEPFLLYLNREEITYYVNGAPLPKISPDLDRLAVMEPTGLQVVDEFITEWDDPESHKAMSEQLNQLLYRFEQLIAYQKSLQLTDRIIIEALRTELVYLTTLSLSGFDTPGSAMGLIDAAVVLDELAWCMAQYEDQLKEVGFNQYDKLQQLCAVGQTKLKKGDFDDFDRFRFTRDVLNPLSTLLLNVQEALKVEFVDEVESLPIPVNMRAPHLFAHHFLNDNYFKQSTGYKDKTAVQRLGEALFFDPILSGNNQRACVSCHAPQLAFAENRAKSLMFDGKRNLSRNSISLVNAVYTEHFFYDLRAGNLRTQFEHVFLNPDEFNTNYAEVENKLNSCEDYQQLFQSAFHLNNKRITKEHVQVALAAYVSTLTSFDSPFDKMIRGERAEEPAVAAGYNLFMGKAQCGTCHFPPTFAGLRPPFYDESESEVLGVTTTSDLDHPLLDNDAGRINSGRPKDCVDYLQRSFKTVTVRNVEKTAPYFHNGAYATLEQVVQFYNKGGGAGLGLEVPHQTLPADSLGLTSTEINQLISFLNSLTSLEGLANVPATLPTCSSPELSKRTIGGQY